MESLENLEKPRRAEFLPKTPIFPPELSHSRQKLAIRYQLVLLDLRNTPLG